MIPTLPEVIAAHEWLTRRYGLSGYRSDAVLAAAREEAEALADGTTDEPAALFYAFARRGHALRDAWAQLTDLLALNSLHSIGFDLTAASGELRSLRAAVASRRAAWRDVSQWFADHMVST